MRLMSGLQSPGQEKHRVRKHAQQRSPQTQESHWRLAQGKTYPVCVRPTFRKTGGVNRFCLPALAGQMKGD